MSDPGNQAMVEHKSSAPDPKGKSRKGPRPKHVPIRTCAICREQGTKRGLTRVVRQPDGIPAIDPSGRLNGRGAYICDKASCWDRAASTDVLAKALNVDLSQEFRDALRQYGQSASTNAETGPTGK
jgi:uncharacterized protein